MVEIDMARKDHLLARFASGIITASELIELKELLQQAVRSTEQPDVSDSLVLTSLNMMDLFAASIESAIFGSLRKGQK